ncbi:hypothetical protein LY76DRAFT_30467 [Colletotrichum caudatum]|nr:hypothetical protein LY76DRAFT_30467 [Colletotrichum caudatum]
MACCLLWYIHITFLHGNGKGGSNMTVVIQSPQYFHLRFTFLSLSFPAQLIPRTSQGPLPTIEPTPRTSHADQG